MLTIRKADERGHFDHGWLDTHHTFSFADYHDPRQMGFRALRVINEDVVAPGQGFGRHGHRDMEILTWILSGALRHEDSSGGGGVIRPGEIQYMSAGSGVLHSEFNASETEPVHLLQIWILPERSGGSPRYDQRDFTASLKPGELVLLASPEGEQGSIAIRRDARLYAVRFGARGGEARRELATGRHAWVQVAKGDLRVGETALGAGDGAAISGEDEVLLRSSAEAEALVFDLP